MKVSPSEILSEFSSPGTNQRGETFDDSDLTSSFGHAYYREHLSKLY